jgi:TolA-binding protein
MKKQKLYIIISLLLIILVSLIFGKKSVNESLVTINTQNIDNMPELIALEKTSTNLTNGLNSLTQQNNGLDQQVKNTSNIINNFQNAISTAQQNYNNWLSNFSSSLSTNPVVKLNLYYDAINSASNITNDMTNLTSQANVDINNNTTSISYTTIDGKQCARFINDMNNYISFPFLYVPQFSFCFWVYIDPNDNNYYTVVSVTNKQKMNPGIQVDIQATKIIIYNALPKNNWWSPIHIHTTQNTSPSWQHICYTYDSKNNYNTLMYVNGVLVSSLNGSGPLSGNEDPYYFPNRIIIGRSGDNYRAYKGYMHDFSYFECVLTSTLIMNHYNLTK